MLDREKYVYVRLMRPEFVFRRLLGLPLFDPDWYANIELAADESASLRAIADSAGGRFENRRLLFLLGAMPRSGTNFLFEMLLRHPRFARPAIPFDEFAAMASPDSFDTPRQVIGRFHPPSGAAFARLEWMAYSMAGFRTRLLSMAADETITVVKEPHVYHVELQPVMFPRDPCILVMRDARYVVDSFYRTFAGRRLGRTFEDVCLETATAMAKTLAFLKDAAPDQVYPVRYEEATADRAGFMSGLLTWLGEEVRAEDLSGLDDVPVLGSSTHSRGADGQVNWEPKSACADFNPATRPIDWTAAQQRIFERHCAGINRQAGYS